MVEVETARDGAALGGAFEGFRRLVLQDPALQLQLRRHHDWTGFSSACSAIAAERGIELSAGELDHARATASRPGIMGQVRPVAREGLDERSPVNFTPVEFDAGTATVEWMDLRGIALEDPFFADTIQRALSEPYRLLFKARTPVDQLAAAEPAPESLELAGLVFHTSRCGSTLISRMLAQLPGVVVFSEPAIVDQLLRAPGVDDAVREWRLRSVVSALTRRREPDQQRAIIKLDAWASRDLELFRRAFASTPWLFVYRQPTAVVTSQLRLPGMPCLPGMIPPELFGLDLKHALSLSRDEYCAIVIATICADALEHLDDSCCLVDYEELPQAAWTKILPHFGISATPRAQGLMQAAAEIDAKWLHRRFDRAASTNEPSAAVRRACRLHAGDAYIRLHELRDARDRARGVPC